LQEWYSQILCLDCGAEERFYRKGYCAARYDEKSKKIVHGLKYGGKGWLSKNIARMMADRLSAGQTEGVYDRIIPVPLHQEKRKKRGYNQAGLIAAELGRITGVSVDQKTLVRSRKTDVMAKLSAPERRHNLAEAFSLGDSGRAGGGHILTGKQTLRDEYILLVDDVYTTGSTADACARTLMNAGAAGVDVIVFAAGQNTFKNQSQART
jgi:ComF family protein